MKIAGRKNDGAWFRFNKALKDIRDGPFPNEVYDFSARLATSEFAADAFAALQALQTEAGITPPESPANASAWCARMADIGVPRQVWMGRLSFTTYTRSGSTGDYEYHANHQQAFHNFGKVVRKYAKEWLFARRASRDLGNVGTQTQDNPGGQPDATQHN